MNERIYFSPAKINLFLEVLSKRIDGYHNINSLMCLCNIGDYLKITENSKFELNIDGPFKACLQNMSQNIIFNVFEIFKKNFSLKKILKLPYIKIFPFPQVLVVVHQMPPPLSSVLKTSINCKLIKRFVIIFYCLLVQTFLFVIMEDPH